MSLQIIPLHIHYQQEEIWLGYDVSRSGYKTQKKTQNTTITT